MRTPAAALPLFALSTSALAGACAPAWDTAFGDPGANGIVRALCSGATAGAPTELLYAAGSFNTIDGVNASRIAQYDGASWTPLGAGVNNLISALTFFDDGAGPQLVAGGNFTMAGAVLASRVARWDGAEWSALGAGVGGPVRALCAHDDGSGGGPALFVGGGFATAGGAAAANIARWDGASWSALSTGLTGGAQPACLALASFDDGAGPALFAGGVFTTAGGAPAANIARWRNGAWTPLDAGLNAEVSALAFFTDSTGPALYAGGLFGQSGATVLPRVARWRSGASAWTPLASGVTHAAATVRALTVFDDGAGEALYIGGVFLDVSGVAASHIARWTGDEWQPVGPGANANVMSLAHGPDSLDPMLALGGQFTSAGGAAASQIAAYMGCASSALLGDLNGDGAVNSSDLAQLLGAWGGAGAPDLNEDGVVNSSDLAILLGNWGG